MGRLNELSLAITQTLWNLFLGGMRHTSTALYFYGASKKTLSPGSLLEI
jgi:hypothetical protein